MLKPVGARCLAAGVVVLASVGLYWQAGAGQAELGVGSPSHEQQTPSRLSKACQPAKTSPLIFKSISFLLSDVEGEILGARSEHQPTGVGMSP